MDETRARFLADLLATGRAHDDQEPDHDQQFRNLDPAGAELLHLLVSARRPGPVLEIGTSNGYSTIWIADALAGRAEFVTVDNDQPRSEEAGRNLADVGLAEGVRRVVQDAGEFLTEQPDERWDLIFLDSNRAAYVDYWPHLRRVLAPGGLLVVDNCTSHAEQVADFRAAVDARADVESVLVPLGSGMLLVTRTR